MTAKFLQRKLLEHQQLTQEIQALTNELKEGQAADFNPFFGGGLLRSQISAPGLI
jgi:hypothetical protein